MTEQYAYSREGLMEMLLASFAIVAQLLSKHRKIKDKCGQRNFPKVNGKREYNDFLLFNELQVCVY